jgi:peptide deformylase
MNSLHIVPVEQIPPASQVGAVPASLIEIYKTCLLMEEVCTNNNGIGLSAVQVGIPWRLFVVRGDDNTYEYFVDCEYEPDGEEKIKSVEGCLSLRAKDGSLRYWQLERFKKIRMKGKRLKAKPKLELANVDFSEDDPVYSVVYQHEIDHHRGILISDIGQEVELRKR